MKVGDIGMGNIMKSLPIQGDIANAHGTLGDLTPISKTSHTKNGKNLMNGKKPKKLESLSIGASPAYAPQTATASYGIKEDLSKETFMFQRGANKSKTKPLMGTRHISQPPKPFSEMMHKATKTAQGDAVKLVKNSSGVSRMLDLMKPGPMKNENGKSQGQAIFGADVRIIDNHDRDTASNHYYGSELNMNQDEQ